jgi:hypothetical protein
LSRRNLSVRGSQLQHESGVLDWGLTPRRSSATMIPHNPPPSSPQSGSNSAPSGSRRLQCGDLLEKFDNLVPMGNHEGRQFVFVGEIGNFQLVPESRNVES